MIIEVINLDESLTENFVKFCCSQLDINVTRITIDGSDIEQENNKEYHIKVQVNDYNATEIHKKIAKELVLMSHVLDKDAHKPAYKEESFKTEVGKISCNLVKKYVDILYTMG